jgi:hypothetical protein
MAIVTVKSTIIANRDAKPVVLTEPGISGGKPSIAMGSVAAATSDSIGSSYLLTQVPSNAYLHSVTIINEALTTMAANIGVNSPTKVDGTAGAVVNATLFASALSLATANQSGTNQINQSGNNSIVNQQQPLWQAAGMASDPGGVLDIVAVSTAAPTAAGNFAVRASFIV